MTASPGESNSVVSLRDTPSPYAVKLSVFEGPLDLLLHLIRLNEVEITEIPIARIGEQYLEYLDLFHELDMEVAGEYLVMAATLAWIKSRMLLPPEGVDEASEEIDPRAELVARLLEYQRFKETADQLGERQLLGRDVFDARPPELEPVPEADREIEVGVFELMEAFRAILQRAGPAGLPHEIESEPITVLDCMRVVMRALEERTSLEFEQIFSDALAGRPSRAVFVSTFLAILELSRLDALSVYQSLDDACVPRGPIHLRRTSESGDSTWAERIADIM